MCRNWSLRVVIDVERWVGSGAFSYRLSTAEPWGDELCVAEGEGGPLPLHKILSHELAALFLAQDAAVADCT